MDRRADPSHPAPARPGRLSRDVYGIGPVFSLVAPLLSLVALAVVLALTVALFTGELPFVRGTGGGTDGQGVEPGGVGPRRTPTPSDVVIVDPRADVPGSIAYVKGGSIWIQSGTSTRQLTRTGQDAMPAWSPDGEWVYFVRTVTDRQLWPEGCRGGAVWYTVTYPILMRVPPDGSAQPEKVTDGLFRSGRYRWFYWLRQPAVSPDGTTVALVSDAPDPCRSDVVLQLFDLSSGKLTKAPVSETVPLGHQDPAWSPDGRFLYYTKNARDGSRGAPAIWRYEPKTKKSRAMTGPGYTGPSVSPNGRFIAATATDAFGTDVVILDARNGSELARVTDDDASWGAAWSPRGDAIAYLHIDGGVVDLRMTSLVGGGPSFELGENLDLTDAADLDPASHPAWFIPRSELPASPAPSSSASLSSPAPSRSAGGAASASP